MVYRTIICIFLSYSIVLSSCSYKQTQILFESQGKTPDSAMRASAYANAFTAYKINPQDVLQIRNLQNIKYIVDDVPQSSTGTTAVAGQGQTFQVEDDGFVALPVIGRIHVEGLTRVEAAKLIEDLYKKTLLKAPIIELKIVNLKVTLLGEAKSQGNFPLVKDRTTLVDVIGQAGGLTEKADERNIKIIRGDQKNVQVTVVNLRNLSALTDPRIILQNNDIIVVAQNKRAVQADKLQNFSTVVQPGLLVLNTALILYTLFHR
jgi:polysaccharide export outer membrane protein